MHYVTVCFSFGASTTVADVNQFVRITWLLRAGGDDIARGFIDH